MNRDAPVGYSAREVALERILAQALRFPDLDIALFDPRAHANLDARDAALALYRTARAFARERGIVIADTKFEFGLLDGEVILIDECLTPDSSRFWPAEEVKPGATPTSFDKQYLRNWLLSTGWNQQPPPPQLPPGLSHRKPRLPLFQRPK